MYFMNLQLLTDFYTLPGFDSNLRAAYGTMAGALLGKKPSDASEDIIKLLMYNPSRLEAVHKFEGELQPALGGK